MNCPWCANPEGLPRQGGQSISPLALVEEIVSCKSLFFDDGGVTFTGGEATLQFGQLEEVLTLLRKENIHTAIETNGTHPDLERLFPLLDLLIIDCKQVNDQIHKERTGTSNQNILENIRKAVLLHPYVWIRIPLVNGFNTSSEDLEGFVSFAKEILESAGENQVKFEFLPYHEYGKSKWKESGRKYPIENGFVSEEIIAMFRETFKANGISVHRT